MKSIDDVRVENLIVLKNKYGSIQKLSDALSRSHGQVSQWINRAKNSTTGEPRGMKSDTARWIESTLNLPQNWLDTNHDAQEGTSKAQIVQRNGLIIEQYDAHGAMGNGLILRDQSGVINEWQVSDEWLRLNIKNATNYHNLKIVTGFGDSMKGMFNSGDPLIIDIGVKSVEFDSVYFFRVGNEGFIKRLQRIPGTGLRAISENKAYESWNITSDMDFEIFGRVIKLWQGCDF